MQEDIELKGYLSISKAEGAQFLIPVDHFFLVKEMQTDVSGWTGSTKGLEQSKIVAAANGKLLKSVQYPWKGYMVSVVIDPKSEEYFLEFTKQEKITLEGI